MDLWVYSRHHPETAAAQRRFHERWRATIDEVVQYGGETGEFKVRSSSEVALRLSAARRLVNLALAEGAIDNVTVAVVRVA